MRISIIIPTYNRSASLKVTLASLIASKKWRHDYEIVVVDNGSKDDTQTLCQSVIKSACSWNISYHYEPVPGLLSGRHRGALESNGDVLTFIDDDIDVDSGWLEAIVEAFDDPSVHLVGGRNLPKYESDPPDWLEAFWYRHGMRKWCDYLSVLDFGTEALEVDPLFIWGLNFSIRRKTLFELGGFHPDYVPEPFEHYQGNAETGLAWKAKSAGLKIIYQPKALVYHRIPPERLTLNYFERRNFLYGINDSYTTIRRNQGIRFDWKMLEPLPKARKLLRRIASRLSKDPYARIKQKVHEAWIRGYLFHQKKAREDPELLEWVLRENYWDYRYGPFKA